MALQPADDDAQRQALVSNFFHFVGDVLSGTDATYRVDSGLVRRDGLMGPVSNTATVGVGADGTLYVRGVTAQQATAAPAAAGGLVITPGMLLLGLLAFLAFKR